jgi:hypothetical protein
MILSFVVNDIVSASYIINQFSNILQEYVIERNPVTGEIEMLVLYFPDEAKEEVNEILQLLELMVVKK